MYVCVPSTLWPIRFHEHSRPKLAFRERYIRTFAIYKSKIYGEVCSNCHDAFLGHINFVGPKTYWIFGEFICGISSVSPNSFVQFPEKSMMNVFAVEFLQ
jgi:hypothetical protein